MAVRAKITVEEFERFVERPENTKKRFEYIGGDVVELVSNNYGSLVAGLILDKSVSFAHKKGLGYVTGIDSALDRGDLLPGFALAAKTVFPD